MRDLPPEEPSPFGTGHDRDRHGQLFLGDPPPPEPEHVKLVLPRDPAPSSPGGEPGDVASEVRQAFLFSPEELGDAAPAESRRHVELGRVGAPTEGRPLPPTGIFKRPVPPPPPEPEPEDEASGNADDIPLSMRIRAWMAGLEWNGRMAIGVAGAFIFAMLLGVWSARGCRGGDADPLAFDPGSTPPPEEVEFVADVPGNDGGETADPEVNMVALVPVVQEVPPVVQAPPPAAQPPPEQPAQVQSAAGLPASLKGWNIAKAKVAEDAAGLTVTFEVPVFESGAYLSKEGQPALQALADKLKGVPAGTRVSVTGFTDNVPLSKPTKDFASNADIAAARAAAAVDFLKYRSRNSGIAWESNAGAETDAPWPNDTKEHRRLNRTVRIRVAPGVPQP